MRFVVLHAHPLEECLSATLRDRVSQSLVDAGCEVTVVRITQGEWISADQLADAEGLVLVYPTWWGGLPAPLLNWVQRELAPWIDGAASRASSPLRNIGSFAAVTTHGSTRWVNRLQGEPGLQLLKRSVAPLCAPGTKLRWVALYNIDRCNQQQINTFITTAQARISAEAASSKRSTGRRRRPPPPSIGAEPGAAPPAAPTPRGAR